MSAAARASLRVARPRSSAGRGLALLHRARLRPLRRGAHSCGVTLMELLLVLVLLVIAASLAIPAITGAFSGVRLRRGSDVVIGRWAEARARAIETGVPYEFRFTPNAGSYRLEPLARIDQEPPAASGKQETSATQKSLDQSPTIESMLPETIQFVAGQSAVQDIARGERRVDPLESSASAWSTPILFFPDGSASTATVVLKNDASQYIRITLRGLTGVARASALLTREEYDESSRAR